MHAADDVLWTKLHVPHRPPTFVARPRLAGRLDQSLAHPGVTVVSAPAGSGKSVVLADACHRRTGPAGWVSLDQHDNDPVRFWRHVAASLDQALGDASGVLAAVEQSTRASSTLGDEIHPTAIVNVLPSDGVDVALILDDYHVIDAEAIHASVRHLLEFAPPALHIAIGTRADPPIKLPRWRARGRQTEIRAADLLFTAAEGGALLRQVAGTGISDDAAAALTERTEGWAVGLQLAGLSLERRDDVESFAAAFTGQHRFVLDYLAEEVLDRQAANVREFLLQTSILDRLCGSLCDAVTGRSDGQQMLEAIESVNLFVTPLDDLRGWWCYHQLFADLLRVRLQQRPDDQLADLHRRAADWHDANGDVNHAIRHALDAGDRRRAAQLIEHHADELLLRREGATLQRWFDRFPPGLLDSRRLALAQARVAVYGGRVGEAEELLDRADALGSASAPPASEIPADRSAGPLSDLDPMSTLLRAFVAHMRGDADGAVELAARAAGGIDDDSSVIALIAHWHLATAPWLRGAVTEAEPALATNIEAWRNAGEHDRAAWAAHYLGRIQLAHGRLDDAFATYHEVLERDADQAEADSPAAGVAHVGIAEIAYRRNELDVARLHARLGISKCAEFVYTQALADGWSVLARIGHAEGDPDAARAAATAERLAPPGDVADLLNPVPAQMAHLALMRGDAPAAARWAAARDLAATTEPRYAHEPAHLTLARILLAQARPAEAIHQLDQLRPLALADGRDGSLIEIEVLRARALAATGDGAGALEALAGAIHRASPQGYIRVFADEGEPVGTLLDQLAAPSAETSQHLDPGYVAALVAACRPDAQPVPADPSRSELVVPLTDRERDVLSEIASGRTNKDIAAELFISLNTVKKHVTHIFDKLGVTNRTAAVARARALGLLADDVAGGDAT